MTQLHLQSSWEYWLSFIKIFWANFSSLSFYSSFHLISKWRHRHKDIFIYLSIYLFIYSSVSSLSSRSIYLVACVHAHSVDFEAFYIASLFYFLTLKLNARISFSWYWVEQWRNNRKWHIYLCNNKRIDEQLERAEYERIDQLESADNLFFKG